MKREIFSSLVSKAGTNDIPDNIQELSYVVMFVVLYTTFYLEKI